MAVSYKKLWKLLIDKDMNSVLWSALVPLRLQKREKVDMLRLRFC